ncbi:MAG: GNAT family N-acetyltransferase [Chloroflexota bacterium]|jgi:ribosomal protein S18 acetylase RimI-like enzyme
MSAKPESALNFANLSMHRIRIMDIATAQAMLEDCAATLRVRYGMGQWGIATTARQIERNMVDRQVMLVHYLGVCVATFTITRIPPSWYPIERFSAPEAKSSYLSNLCVMPSFQGRGVGRWCITKACDIAQRQGSTVLRSDVYTEITEAVHFANNVGFNWCAEISYSNHSHWLCEIPLTL